MARKPTIKTVPPEEIPEVIEVMRLSGRLEEIKKKYAGVVQELSQIAEQYNAAVESAAKVVREKQVSCGPFQLYQFSTTYDAKRLFEEIGREDFLKVGGKISQVTTFDLDKGSFEAFVAIDSIPKEVVAVVVKHRPTFHIPEKVKMP